VDGEEEEEEEEEEEDAPSAVVKSRDQHRRNAEPAPKMRAVPKIPSSRDALPPPPPPSRSNTNPSTAGTVPNSRGSGKVKVTRSAHGQRQ
jgi:hypothetical protein